MSVKQFLYRIQKGGMGYLCALAIFESMPPFQNLLIMRTIAFVLDKELQHGVAAR